MMALLDWESSLGDFCSLLQDDEGPLDCTLAADTTAKDASTGSLLSGSPEAMFHPPPATGAWHCNPGSSLPQQQGQRASAESPHGSAAAMTSSLFHHSNSADDLDTISYPAHHPSTSHSSVEKQRRDRLNGLIEHLATIVPPSGSGDRYSTATAPGSRRPKHVVLSDAIRTIKALQEHMRHCTNAPTSKASTPASPTATNTTAMLSAPSGSDMMHSCSSSQLEFPLALDLPANGTGVMVEGPTEPGVYLLRVTCRDRPGLLADVSAAVRGLSLTIRAASIVTTREGKAQHVYEVVLLDSSLAPEEIQCAVNAALYAHLITPSAAPASGTTPTTNAAACGDAAAAQPPAAKRTRLA